MITLNGITKKVGPRILFEDVTVSFDRHRYGLTGPNGAGKSTLLRIIMGQEASTAGSVSLPRKVGFLKQTLEPYRDMKVTDVVIMGNERLWSAFVEREKLYEMEITDEIGMQLAGLEEIINEENGYAAEADAEVLLQGMGISPTFYQSPLHALPTDQQFRVLLCQALFGNPEALLLDEPTNHLDLESIEWLEQFLHGYSGTLIVVSHDRHFLNEVVTHIADIDYDSIIIYPGNYDDMLVVKSTMRERAEQENKTKEKKIAQLREFVARFGAGTRASQVQSRLREIERLEPQELKKSNIQRPYIRFYPPEKASGQEVFRVQNLYKSYNGRPVIENFSRDIVQGEKIGIIGNNGRGKTTLLKMLAGKLLPDSGRIELGHQVEIGYFPQNHEEVVDKSSHMTTFDWLKARREGVYDQDVRSILGKLLFSGDDAFKPISALSGGETARLIIGGLMLCNVNVLILDEPNNHLDLESVSALGWALQIYSGTLLFASHDRQLINMAAEKLICFEETGLRLFEGTLDEYLYRFQVKR